MITACISLAHHDSSLCILKDEKIKLFIQEERITRVKRSSILTDKYLHYLKKQKIDQLILINFFNQEVVDNFIAKLNKEKIKINNIIVDYVNHHLFHAASAFYLSGFKKAIALVIDGWGALFENNFYETTSIFEARYNNRHTSYNIYQSKDYDLKITHRLDVGVMYGTVSKYLGFDRLDGGKTMGLSGYGKPSKNIPDILYKDEANMNLFKSDRTLDVINLNKKNLAYAMQKALEKIFIKNIKYIKNKTNIKNIVFSGGCALNVLGNSEILKHYRDINLFIDPVPTDSGQSIGGAYYYYYKNASKPRQTKLNNIFLGPEYDIEKEINYESNR